MEFDLYAKASPGAIFFEGMQLRFHYPVSALGEYAVSKGKISVKSEVIIANQVYKINLIDFSENSFLLDIGASCTNVNQRYVLDNNYEKLAHLTIELLDWNAIGNLSIQDFALEGRAKWYHPEVGCERFSLLCVENGLIPLDDCEIFSHGFAPYSAGDRDISTGERKTITFKGTGFGYGLDPGARILVPNADDGGATFLTILGLSRLIKTWTPNEIEVYISSNVGANGSIGDFPPIGSGDWKIYPNTLLGCTESIEIDYALSNFYGRNDEDWLGSLAKKSDIVPSNSVEWYIHTPSIPVGISLTDIEKVAKQAFCDWEAISAIETKYIGTTTAINTDDQRITIYFEPSNSVPPKKILAETNLSYGTFSCGDPYFDFRLIDNNIVFDNTTNWFVGTNGTPSPDQYDFYSVLMHEIGHALGMDHSMDLDPSNGTKDNRLMYYELANKQDKRSIDSKTVDGVRKLASLTTASLKANIPACFDADYYGFERMTVGCVSSTDDLSITSKVVNLNKQIVHGYDILQILSEKEIQVNCKVINSQGRIFSNENLTIQDGSTSIQLENLPNGFYFLNLKNDTGSFHNLPFIVFN